MNQTAAAAKAPSTRLSLKHYLGYGLGDFAFNFYWLPLQVFLLKYYTDVLGLSSDAAGLIVMICLIWDGLVDPYVGILASRTRSRFGRYRPYMLYGSVPLAISFSLVFLPVPFEQTALIVYALATQLLFRSVYAAVNIPYGAMMASMTRDSMERNNLAGVRMLFAFGGSAIVGYFTPRLVAWFGVDHPDSAHFLSAALLSSIATIVLFLSFAGTEERVDDDAHASSNVKLWPMLKMISRNVPFMQASAAIALFGVASTATSASLAYYVEYVLHKDATVTGNLISMIPLVQMLAILPWTWFSRRIGKRWAWILGLLIAIVSVLVLFAWKTVDQTALTVLIGLSAFGCASIAVNFWSIVPDTVEYGEWQSGIRAEGFVFGLVTLIQKTALGLANAFVGMYLTWIGYVPNQAQTEEAQRGLLHLITVVPAVAMLASCAVMIFYRLNTKRHAEIVRQIAERRQAAAA